jgi:hypothetical protein
VGDPIYLYFQASGGTGSYTFNVVQFIQVWGTATYANGTFNPTEPFHIDAQYPGQLTQNGSSATYFDAPGAILYTGSLGLLASASETWDAVTTAWVSDGLTTVLCGSYYWTPTVTVTVKPGYLWLSGQSKVTG